MDSVHMGSCHVCFEYSLSITLSAIPNALKAAYWDSLLGLSTLTQSVPGVLPSPAVNLPSVFSHGPPIDLQWQGRVLWPANCSCSAKTFSLTLASFLCEMLAGPRCCGPLPDSQSLESAERLAACLPLLLCH